MEMDVGNPSEVSEIKTIGVHMDRCASGDTFEMGVVREVENYTYGT